MDSRDTKSSPSPSLSDPSPLNPTQPSFPYLAPPTLSSLPSNPITPSTTLLPSAPHLTTQPQPRPLFASHRKSQTRDNMHHPSQSNDSHQSHPQSLQRPQVHPLPSSSQPLPKLDPFSRPLSHSVMEAQDHMRPTHLPRASPLSSAPPHRYDLTSSHQLLAPEQQLRSHHPPPYNSSPSRNQLPQIQTRTAATSPMSTEPLPQMALPQSSQQRSPSIDAQPLRTVSPSIQTLPPQPPDNHLQPSSNDRSPGLSRSSSQQKKSALGSPKQISRQYPRPRSQFGQVQQSVDRQRSSQPRQPPPLPPRPAMLAPPRGSVVMQDVPRYQRQVVPSVSTHPTHTSQIHDAGSPRGNQRTSASAIQQDAMKQHASSVDHQGPMYHHGMLPNPRQMTPVPAMAQQMPASPTVAMGSSQHSSQQHVSMAHRLEHHQQSNLAEDHGNPSAFPRDLGKHDRSLSRVPVTDLRTPGQCSSGQTSSGVHLNNANRLGARGDGDMYLSTSMRVGVDGSASPRRGGDKGPRIFSAESIQTPMRDEESQNVPKILRAQGELLLRARDSSIPASQTLNRNQHGITGSADGRTNIQGQAVGEQHTQEFRPSGETAARSRGSGTIEEFVGSPQITGIGGSRNLLERQRKLQDEEQLKKDSSPSTNPNHVSTGLRPPHNLSGPSNKFPRSSHERNMESGLLRPLIQAMNPPQAAEGQRFHVDGKEWQESVEEKGKPSNSFTTNLATGESKDTNRGTWRDDEPLVAGLKNSTAKTEGQAHLFELVSSRLQASGEATTPLNPNVKAVSRASRPTNSSSRMSTERHQPANLISNQMEGEDVAHPGVGDDVREKHTEGSLVIAGGRDGSYCQSTGMSPPSDSKKKSGTKEGTISQRQGVNRSTAADDNGSNQRKQLKVEDALAYLEKVKSQFADQVSVYNQFLDIMKEFKADEIDTNEVIRRVSNLFRGHKDLILGFNTFLPPGYKIRVIENAKTGILNTGFHGPAGVFSLLSPHRKIPAKVPGVKPGAKKRGNAISSPKEKESKHQINTSDGQVGPLTSSMGTEQPEKDVSMTPTHTTAGRSGITGRMKSAAARRPHGFDGSNLQNSRTLHQSISKTGVTEARAHEFERAIGFVTAIKERFADSPDTFNEFLDALRRFREEQKSIREVFEAVADLFGSHKDLLSQFKEFIPTIAFSGIPDAKTIRDRGLSQGPRRNQDTKVISESTPNRRPGALNGAALNGKMRPRHRLREMQFFEDLKVQLGPSKAHLYTEFIKCLSLFSQGIVSREELLHLTGEILHDDQDAHASFLDYLDAMANTAELLFEGEHHISSSVSSEGEPTAVDAARMAYYASKPMSEIAAEAGIEQMHSYRRMPHDFPPCEYSGRSVQEKRTLNDTWINVTTGSEDYSFKFMRRNQNEDNLFRCEDDRYELDLVIETNASTIMKLETIVATMSKLPLSEKKRHALAPGALTPIHFNAIQRIYGESGPEVISQLKMNPSVAVPVILKRLKEKDITWRGARMDMNRVWREVGERNFHRSLDHRSSHFKAVDKKDLSTKSLLMDIMDPVASVTAREAEVTRARGYPVENGGGGANHRSQALKAVLAAAQSASDKSSRRLELIFGDSQMHRVVHQLLNDVVEDEIARKSVVQFGKMIERFFRVRIEESQTSRPNNSGLTVLYGDDAVYIVMRLYHLLFERVALAFDLAREQIADRERRAKLNEEGNRRLANRGGLANIKTKPWALTKTMNSQEADSKFSLGPSTESLDEICDQFLELAKQFARAKVDWSKYEDKCRTLLGVDSYALFTIDKTIQKLIKAIEAMFSGDSCTKGLCELFHECQRRLKDSKMHDERLDTEGIEVLYSVAASRHVAEMRGAGSNLMRLQSSCEENGGSAVVIHVIGQIGDEDRTRVVDAEKAVLDMFLEFCGAYGDFNANRRTDEDKEATMSDKANTGCDGNIGEGATVKSKRGSGGKLEVKKGGRRCEFLRYRMDDKKVRENLQSRSLMMKNGLEWLLDGKGVMRYASGTCDFLFNTGRKRRWDEGLKADAVNETCSRRKKMRKILGLDVKQDDRNEQKKNREEDVTMTDIDNKQQEIADVVVEQASVQVSSAP